MFQKVFNKITEFCFAFMLFWIFGELNCVKKESFDSWMEALPIFHYLEKKDNLTQEERDLYDKILKANQDYLKEQVEVENQDCIYQVNDLSDIAETVARPILDLSLESLSDFEYIMNQFYIVDSATATNAQQIDAADFLSRDFSLNTLLEGPQIIIYHTHSQEGFLDSDLSKPEERIIGVGEYLTELLEKQYGYKVLHVTEEFDLIDGIIDRSAAYERSEYYIEEMLEKYPSVEVVIDLHRDGVPEDRHLVTEINGKPTAMLMNFNGLSYLAEEGPIDYLPNTNLQDNLAFSFQLMYQAALYYPELYRGNYLAAYRYNLELLPKAILLEAGAQTNTLQEVKNAMEPFADILNKVLQRK